MLEERQSTGQLEVLGSAEPSLLAAGCVTDAEAVSCLKPGDEEGKGICGEQQACPSRAEAGTLCAGPDRHVAVSS